MISIPDGLVESTLHREGEQGRRWLERLPALIDNILDQWGCEIVEQPWHGEIAIVIPVRRGSEDAVVKISFPHASADNEAGALRLFGGRGTVRLLEVDDRFCALLLERAGPYTLESLPSADETIEVAGELARRMAIPAPTGSPSLAGSAGSWAEQLEDHWSAGCGLLPSGAVEQALETIGMLAEDSTTTMMHGDLHGRNVLAAVREPWLAIDPVGRRGTAAFDAFTVVAGCRKGQTAAADSRTIRARIRRYAAAADVDPDVAGACCQARATSAYLHQQLVQGDWFDLGFLRSMSCLGLQHRGRRKGTARTQRPRFG